MHSHDDVDKMRPNLFCSLSENASLGTILTPFIFIRCYHSDETLFESYIIGDYVIMLTPVLSLSAPSPWTVDMKEESDISVGISYPAGPVAPSVVAIYMPNSVSRTDPAIDIYGKMFSDEV